MSNTDELCDHDWETIEETMACSIFNRRFSELYNENINQNELCKEKLSEFYNETTIRTREDDRQLFKAQIAVRSLKPQIEREYRGNEYKYPDWFYNTYKNRVCLKCGECDNTLDIEREKINDWVEDGYELIPYLKEQEKKKIEEKQKRKVERKRVANEIWKENCNKKPKSKSNTTTKHCDNCVHGEIFANKKVLGLFNKTIIEKCKKCNGTGFINN